MSLYPPPATSASPHQPSATRSTPLVQSHGDCPQCGHSFQPQSPHDTAPYCFYCTQRVPLPQCVSCGARNGMYSIRNPHHPDRVAYFSCRTCYARMTGAPLTQRRHAQQRQHGFFSSHSTPARHLSCAWCGPHAPVYQEDEMGAVRTKCGWCRRLVSPLSASAPVFQPSSSSQQQQHFPSPQIHPYSNYAPITSPSSTTSHDQSMFHQQPSPSTMNMHGQGAFNISRMFGPITPEQPHLKHTTTDETHIGDRDDDLMQW